MFERLHPHNLPVTQPQQQPPSPPPQQETPAQPPARQSLGVGKAKPAARGTSMFEIDQATRVLLEARRQVPALLTSNASDDMYGPGFRERAVAEPQATNRKSQYQVVIR
jgi:hypothetical protein